MQKDKEYWIRYWRDKAPALIEDVASELLKDRPIVQKTENQISFGNKGSFRINIEAGTFFDFEQETGGGLLQMISHVLGVDNDESKQWLRTQGFLEDTYKPKTYNRPKQERNNGTDDNKFFKVGRQLWNEAKPIPREASHSVRRWARRKNLLPIYLDFPNVIRYHIGQGLIVAAMSDINSWISPQNTTIKAFHAIAIDKNGNKRMAFGVGSMRNDKRIFGKMKGAGIVMLGDTNDDVVNICEGVADALSIYSRVKGAVIASITTIAKLDKPEIIDYLVKRKSMIFSDNDKPGQDAAKKLIQSIISSGGQGMYITPNAKDPADAAIKDPFPTINHETFEIKYKEIGHKSVRESKRIAFVEMKGELENDEQNRNRFHH